MGLLIPLVQKSDHTEVYTNHHRRLVVYNLFAYKGKNKLHGVQLVLEALADAFDKEDSRDEYNSKDLKMSNVGQFLWEITRCVDPKGEDLYNWRQVCEYITSPKMILTKIANNPNVAPVLKTEALRLTESINANK